MSLKRRQRGQRPIIHVIAFLAVLAVPAVSWALPQHTTSRPPGMAAGGGGGAAAGSPASPVRSAAPSTQPAVPPRAATQPQPPAQPQAAAPPQPAGPAQPQPAAPARPAAAPALAPPRAAATTRPAAQAPAPASVPAAGAAPAGQGDDPVAKILAEGAATAALLHGAIAVRDWEAARREHIALQDVLARMREPDLRAPALSARVLQLQLLTPLVDGAITRQDMLRANDAAYRLVYGLVDAITAQPAPRGGGGGAQAQQAPAATVPPAVDHLRQGYPEVMQAHAALLRGEPTEARLHLDAVREHLQTALKAQPGAVFGRRLDDLNKRRWRVVAALGNPARARQLSVALTRAYAEAVHAVGQYASTGGGGGTTTTPAAASRAAARAPRAQRATQRPAKERLGGADAVPYDKRDR